MSRWLLLGVYLQGPKPHGFQLEPENFPPILHSLGGEKEAKVRYRPMLAKDGEFSSARPHRGICGKAGIEEMRAGFSLFGPHRDEVLVELDGYDARRFSSRGEKRLLTLSLKTL